MAWQMDINPLGNLGFSALVASIPILFLFWALAYKRMKGHWAGFWTVLIAIVIAVIVYKMPLKLALLSTFNGFLFGLWPVSWIVITAILSL